MILGVQNYDQGLLQAKITTTDLHCIRSGCHGLNANDLNVTESSVWGEHFLYWRIRQLRVVIGVLFLDLPPHVNGKPTIAAMID